MKFGLRELPGLEKSKQGRLRIYLSSDKGHSQCNHTETSRVPATG